MLVPFMIDLQVVWNNKKCGAIFLETVLWFPTWAVPTHVVILMSIEFRIIDIAAQASKSIK